MKNLKIRVNSEAESKEAQELFFKLGYKDRKNWTQKNPIHESIQAWEDGEFTFSLNHNQVPVGFKEITLPELREMANPMKEYLEKQTDGTYALVLRGDSCKDDDIEVPEGMNYAYDAGSFVQFTKQEMGYRDSVLVWQRELREMANPMKEYLNSNCNYELVLSNKKYDGFIEIPGGAIRARFYPHDPDGLEFENAFCQWWSGKNQEWLYFSDYAGSAQHGRVVWQRDQDEPFLTPECTMNDQYAEIEQVRQVEIHGNVKAAQASGGVDATLTERQSQYGCYEDVAHVTQQILSALRVGNYDELPAPMKESLHMIASKMARIVNGDPEYLDNWHDIGGYAKLIEKLIKGE